MPLLIDWTIIFWLTTNCLWDHRLLPTPSTISASAGTETSSSSSEQQCYVNRSDDWHSLTSVHSTMISSCLTMMSPFSTNRYQSSYGSLLSDRDERDIYLRSLFSMESMIERFFFASIEDINEIRSLAEQFSGHLDLHGHVPDSSSSIRTLISQWQWKQYLGAQRYHDCMMLIDTPPHAGDGDNHDLLSMAVADDWRTFDTVSHRAKATRLPRTPLHRMSPSSLLFGQILGHALNISPIQAAIMSPAGGLVGAGDSFLRPALESSLRYWSSSRSVGDWHSSAHDAAGYLWKNFQLGPGYAYSPWSTRFNDDQWLPKSIGLSGQRSGIAYWKKIMPPSLSIDQICSDAFYRTMIPVWHCNNDNESSSSSSTSSIDDDITPSSLVHPRLNNLPSFTLGATSKLMATALRKAAWQPQNPIQPL